MKHAELEPDARFTFLWIAFNAVNAQPGYIRRMVARDGIEPSTRGFSVFFSGSWGIINQPLAALASPGPRHTMAQSRHTQSDFDAIPSRCGAKPCNTRRHLSRHPDQRFHQGLIDIEVTFVFRNVSFAVRLLQHTPLFRRKLHGVLQALKDQVSILRPVAVPPQSCQRERVSGVVGKIAAAVEAQILELRILEPGGA